MIYAVCYCSSDNYLVLYYFSCALLIYAYCYIAIVSKTFYKHTTTNDDDYGAVVVWKSGEEGEAGLLASP